MWAPTGRADLSSTDRAKVTAANVLYDFTGDIAQLCIDHRALRSSVYVSPHVGTEICTRQFVGLYRLSYRTTLYWSRSVTLTDTAVH